MERPTQAESAAVQQLARAILDLLVAVEAGHAARHPPAPTPAVVPHAPSPPPPATTRPLAPTQPAPYLLTRLEAAKFLSVSPGTMINRTAPRGRIPSVKIGAAVRYTIDDLKAEVERCRVAASSP
jgi:hypothetical protein